MWFTTRRIQLKRMLSSPMVQLRYNNNNNNCWLESIRPGRKSAHRYPLVNKQKYNRRRWYGEFSATEIILVPSSSRLLQLQLLVHPQLVILHDRYSAVSTQQPSLPRRIWYSNTATAISPSSNSSSSVVLSNMDDENTELISEKLQQQQEPTDEKLLTTNDATKSSGIGNRTITKSSTASSSSSSSSSPPRRRRPLRKSIVQNMGEQRLHHTRGPEYEQRWNTNLKKFATFVRERQQRRSLRLLVPNNNNSQDDDGANNMNVVQMDDYPREKSLRRWIFRLRIEYQKRLRGQHNHLTEHRARQLRKLGFQFIETKLRNSWDLRFKQLCTYLEENNGRYPHEWLSKLDRDGMDLYRWCNRQRVLYKLFKSGNYSKTYINKERIQRLNKINFVWSLLDLQWDEKYVELKKYRDLNGNCMVPAKYVGNLSLARWVETQRRQYALRLKKKRTALTEERIKLLDDIDFAWDPYELKWLERYDDLIEYQSLNGEGAMPTSRRRDGSVYRWIATQRKQVSYPLSVVGAE
jgi:hypothetical protein